MNDIGAQPGKIKAYGLVRGKDGSPVFDDIYNIPKPIWDMLTPQEQEQINNVRNAQR